MTSSSPGISGTSSLNPNSSTFPDGITVTGDAALNGNILVMNIPTADPGVAGQLWSNLGILTVSAG